MKKITSGIMLTLFLTSIMAFNIQLIEATGSIEIRADGTVYPPTAPIRRDGNIYTLTANISESIVVLKDNIVIDGNNYVVDAGLMGAMLKGIDLSNRYGVTVKNIVIKNFNKGIYLFSNSKNNKILNLTITSCSMGIAIEGFVYEAPSLNSILGNIITGNSYGISIQAYQTWRPHNNTISQNIITKNKEYGVISESYYNDFSSNVIKENGKVGIVLYGDAYNNTVSFNTIINNGDEGIRVQGPRNIIFNNTIMNHKYGIHITPTGIVGYSGDCRYNEIYNNIIANNTWYGIYIEAETGFYKTSSNRIYHNDFINNTVQAYSYNSRNTWDASYPSGGNYWNDYAGVDEKSGSNQDQFGSDSIGDTPYTIDTFNKDRYPLMEPYVIPEFPSTTILPLLMILSILVVVFAKKNAKMIG